MSATAIGIDIGGTKIAAGIVDESGTVRDFVTIATPAAPELTSAIVALTRPLLDASVAGVGVSVAGFVDRDRSSLLFSPNIPGWTGVQLQVTLAEALSCPVILENDANAAAWGEARFGAGRGIADMVCLTVGTGLGGGLVLDGRLYRGSWGFAAELGHLNLVPDGRPCACGLSGCWETYVSGRALVAEAITAASTDPRSAEVLSGLVSGDLELVTGQMVMAAARAGDEAARLAYRTVGTRLGAGMAQLAAVLDPRCFVVGGGVVEGGDLLLEPARASFAEGLTAGDHRPHASIVPAQLGPRAGLAGAADLAFAAAGLPAR